jgi:hypothetical protein
MSDVDSGTGNQALQFDRVATDAAISVVPAKPSATCGSCQRAIDTVYYQINGITVCEDCRLAAEAAADPPLGLGPLLTAALFGAGAGLVGAAIYYGVIALARLEIGIVAILIGYMVGYAVRRGAGGRGGRRFQFLAVALTYGSVALAYTPLAIQGAMDEGEQDKTVISTSTSEPESESGGLLVAIVYLVGFAAILPVLVIFGSMPSGLISAAIIFFGMRQAWTLTGAPTLVVQGPYRVGSDLPPALA